MPWSFGSFDVNVNVNVNLPGLSAVLALLQAGITTLEAQMSHISDAIAVNTTATNALIARILAELPAIEALQAENAELRVEAVTPEDLDALNANSANLDAANPTTPSVLPTP